MRRYFLVAVGALIAGIIQYGFLEQLSGVFGAIPLLTVIGLYTFMQLKTRAGLLWFVIAGAAADVHSVTATGELFVGIILGLALMYILQQYVTHASIYAAAGISVGVLLIWNFAARLLLGAGASGTLASHGLWGTLEEVLVGTVLLLLFMAVLPRLHTSMQQFIRFT